MSKAFPKAALTGCLFHLAKSVHRKLCELGYKVNYDTDESFNIKLKCFTALAFLPASQVLDAFLCLTSDDSVPIEFVTYFEVTYIGAERGPRNNRQRVPGLFPISLWNVHQRTLNDEPRTNNSIEAFHNALQSSVTNAHPTIWKLIDCLQREDSLASKKLLDIRTGVHESKSKYRKLNEKLKFLVRECDGEDTQSFLETIAACLHSF